MAVYSKSHLTLPKQLQLLKSRGLLVLDDAEAMACLHRNGYYRLSAYWYPFRKIEGGIRADSFLDGSYFEDAQALYVFDKELKLHLLDAIERVEIAVRADIALTLGKRQVFAHEHAPLLHPNFAVVNYRYDHAKGRRVTRHEDWLDRFHKAVGKSRDEFITHYYGKYDAGSPLPIWIAIELWDFGLLSHFYSGMRDRYRRQVASRFAVPDWQLMESWLITLNYVRNVIAHHGRLWNLNLADQPMIPKAGVMVDFDALAVSPTVNSRIYSVCCILCHFSKIINPHSTWPQKLSEIVRSFPVMPHAGIQDMGFPADWQDQSLWQ